jgi:hypothetical protein
VIKESADKVGYDLARNAPLTPISQIARSAKEDLRPYDKGVDGLKNDLQRIRNFLVEILQRVKGDKEQLLAELTKKGSNTDVDNK